MINLDQLKQEVSDITHEFDRKVAMQVIDYLSENGYLKDEWQPIATAPKDGNRVCLALWNNENYLCWITIGWWDKKRKAWWHNPDGRLIPPTHWMPLQQSPKGEK